MCQCCFHDHHSPMHASELQRYESLTLNRGVVSTFKIKQMIPNDEGKEVFVQVISRKSHRVASSMGAVGEVVVEYTMELKGLLLMPWVVTRLCQMLSKSQQGNFKARYGAPMHITMNFTTNTQVNVTQQRIESHAIFLHGIYLCHPHAWDSLFCLVSPPIPNPRHSTAPSRKRRMQWRKVG